MSTPEAIEAKLRRLNELALEHGASVEEHPGGRVAVNRGVNTVYYYPYDGSVRFGGVFLDNATPEDLFALLDGQPVTLGSVEPTTAPERRQIMQISAIAPADGYDSGEVAALCNDGSVWVTPVAGNFGWERMLDIPQDDEE